jgi:FkbM family methyltransferase
MPSKRDRAKWAARREFENVVRMLRPGDVAIDCGANVGKFTEKMARTGATVYAFEPDPYCIEILRKKFSDALNVEICANAVGTESGSVKLYRHLLFEQNPKKYSESSSICPTKRNVRYSSRLVVGQINLIEFIVELNRPIKLMKLDIEGSEVPILELMFKTGIIRNVENLFVEMHESQLPNVSDRILYIKTLALKQNYTRVNLSWG